MAGSVEGRQRGQLAPSQPASPVATSQGQAVLSLLHLTASDFLHFSDPERQADLFSLQPPARAGL